MDVKLEFSEALNVQERDEVVTILYKKIVLNGTFGELLIEGLKVLNNEGIVFILKLKFKTHIHFHTSRVQCHNNNL